MVLSTNGVINGTEYAGWSPAKTRVKDPESAYSVVVARYADANLSFQHELGHHFGAYHDPKSGTGDPPFYYAQGFRNACKWRTIMGYPPKPGECREGEARLLMWSSCNLWHDGTLAGGIEQNNVKIINRMSGWIAGFRP